MSKARKYCGDSSSNRSQAEHWISDGRDDSRSFSSEKSRRKHFGDEDDAAYLVLGPEDFF